jgi:hypothetical protein
MDYSLKIEQEAEQTYREYPNNPLDKPDWHYNKDVNCFKKRKAFIKGALSNSAKEYWYNKFINENS